MERTINANRDNGDALQVIGGITLRYALVLVLLWIGGLKFTAYEAEGVYKHASHSPLLSWGYQFLSTRTLSSLLGVFEIAFATLIAIKPVLPRLSLLGSLGAIVMFLTTLSFMVTDLGVWQKDYGFPALSASPGQFLIKDTVLLAAAIWTAGESLRAARWNDEVRKRK